MTLPFCALNEPSGRYGNDRSAGGAWAVVKERSKKSTGGTVENNIAAHNVGAQPGKKRRWAERTINFLLSVLDK